MMEHLFHFFGGGCGEHMLLPGIAITCSSIVVWVRSKFTLKTIKQEQ